eukprot:sb/3472468/
MLKRFVIGTKIGQKTPLLPKNKRLVYILLDLRRVEFPNSLNKFSPRITFLNLSRHPESRPVSCRRTSTKRREDRFMATGHEEPSLVTASGRQLEWVKDFVYLGAHLRSTEHDFNVRKAKAWAACHRLRSVWKTDISRTWKIAWMAVIVIYAENGTGYQLVGQGAE